MAQWIRSVYSAAHHQETLSMFSARDYIQNVEARDLQAVRDQLLKVPNSGLLPDYYEVILELLFTFADVSKQASKETLKNSMTIFRQELLVVGQQTSALFSLAGI